MGTNVDTVYRIAGKERVSRKSSNAMVLGPLHRVICNILP
jgi:hypothetical protein